jgi:hypothetical protein
MTRLFENTFCILGDEEHREALFGYLEACLDRFLPDPLKRDLFYLAVVEAVNNAVEHGNQDQWDRTVTVRLLAAPQLMLFSVTDQGPGFTPRDVDLKQVVTLRGRGVGLMRANTDLLLFNAAANQAVLIKGGRILEDVKDLGRIAQYDHIVFIADLKAKRDQGRYHVISEALDRIKELGRRRVFVDLRDFRILNSRDWGVIFAEVEDRSLEAIVLFNAGEAVMASARQMGVMERSGVYEKIKVLPDVDSALDLLTGFLKETGETAPPQSGAGGANP